MHVMSVQKAKFHIRLEPLVGDCIGDTFFLGNWQMFVNVVV